MIHVPWHPYNATVRSYFNLFSSWYLYPVTHAWVYVSYAISSAESDMKTSLMGQWIIFTQADYRADSSFAPSQWEMALLCNGLSHWLAVSLESALWLYEVNGTQSNQDKNSAILQTKFSKLNQFLSVYFIEHHPDVKTEWGALKGCSPLTQWCLVMPHDVIGEDIFGSVNGLAPSHYLKRCWLTVNWTLGNKHQWNLNRNLRNKLQWKFEPTFETFQENTFENAVYNRVAILFNLQTIFEAIMDET